MSIRKNIIENDTIRYSSMQHILQLFDSFSILALFIFFVFLLCSFLPFSFQISLIFFHFQFFKNFFYCLFIHLCVNYFFLFYGFFYSLVISRVIYSFFQSFIFFFIDFCLLSFIYFSPVFAKINNLYQLIKEYNADE